MHSLHSRCVSLLQHNFGASFCKCVLVVHPCIPPPDTLAHTIAIARPASRQGLQALHCHLKAQGQLSSDPIPDVAALFDSKPGLQSFLQNNQSGFSHRTPLWFYCLAEAEAAGGESLGELGSWIVASTFIGVMLGDPTSALSSRFRPMDSPLRTEKGMPVDTIARWMEFALVMEPKQSGNFAQAGATTSEELTV